MSKLHDANEPREEDDSNIDIRENTERNVHISTEARHAIAIGDGYTEIENPVETSEPGNTPGFENTRNADTGKVLTDDNEPGVSVHLHSHEGGVTISVKDLIEGKVERYNFNTGEAFEKNVSDMSFAEAQRRMRSEHTDYNPNPDRKIPGFRSSTWPDPSRVEDGSEDES